VFSSTCSSSFSAPSKTSELRAPAARASRFFAAVTRLRGCGGIMPALKENAAKKQPHRTILFEQTPLLVRENFSDCCAMIDE